MKMGACTREVGFLTKGTARATKNLVTETSIWGTILMAKLMVKVCTLGLMAKPMMVSGRKESSMATEFGKVITATLTSGSGLKIKLMAMVYMNGRMGTGMKVNGSSALDMGKALIPLRMVTSISVNTAMAKLMVMVNIAG